MFASLCACFKPQKENTNVKIKGVIVKSDAQKNNETSKEEKILEKKQPEPVANGEAKRSPKSTNSTNENDLQKTKAERPTRKNDEQLNDDQQDE